MLLNICTCKYKFAKFIYDIVQTNMCIFTKVNSSFLLAFFMLSRCFSDFYVGVGAFVIGLS